MEDVDGSAGILSGASLALSRRSLVEFHRLSIVDTLREESPDWLLLATLQLLLLLLLSLLLLHMDCWSASMAVPEVMAVFMGELQLPMNTEEEEDPSNDTAANDAQEDDVDEGGDGSFMLHLLTLDILGTSSCGVLLGDAALPLLSRRICTAVHEFRRRSSLPTREAAENFSAIFPILLFGADAAVAPTPPLVLPLQPPPLLMLLCFIIVVVVVVAVVVVVRDARVK